MLNIFTQFRKRSNVNRLEVMPLGFHGDLHLISVVDLIVSQGVTSFIETGTNVGSTLKFVANKYPTLDCFSCEPDPKAFQNAKNNIDGKLNVKLFNLLSQEFIKTLENEHSTLFDKKTFFWLDAHGYGFEWPLKQEISFITENFSDAFILIDDFKVPQREMFGFDEYQGQECSFEYIKGSINGASRIELFYPNYTKKTSQQHPLRGWGLIKVGGNFEIPNSMNSLIIKAL